MKKQILRILTVCLALTLLLSVNIQAASNQSFSRLETSDSVLTVAGRDIYDSVKTIKASDFGLENPFKGLTDIYCADDGKIYILCGGDSKVYVINDDYSFDRELVITDSNGQKLSFQGALGIYADRRGNIFVSDSENSRILVSGTDGIVRQIIEKPVADLVPDDFVFTPASIVEDNDGNYYVLSQGSYYGALVFNSSFEFTSFYGANTVSYSVLDTLGKLWELLTSTNAKKAKQIRVLPTAFVDLAADGNGYIYSCTGILSTYNTNNGKGQISMMSPGGSSILQKRKADGTSVASSSYNFLETKVYKKSTGLNRLQNLVAIDVNKSGYIFALDQVTGLVYVFDQDCNLLGTFGGGTGKGQELGTFKNPVSLSLIDDRVFVADSESQKITVFAVNDFGKKLEEAQILYRSGNYIEAKPLWEEIYSLDQNCQYAYRGLAKTYYAEGNYKLAADYAKEAYDYSTYDMAYSRIRNAFISDNFVWLFILAVALIVGLIVLLIKIKKRETPLIKNVKLHTMFNTIAHPFASFNDIKYKKQGSLLYAVILLLLFTVTSNLRMTCSSFLYRTADATNYNVLYTIATTIGLIVLWSVSNWLTSTLMSGKGTLKEIFIASTYSMLPMIVYNILYLVLSHCLSYDDSAFLTGLSTIALAFTAYILCIAIMTVQEYSFGKMLFTTLITVFLMILIVFIIFMVVILLQQFGNFFYTIYMEVLYR